MTEHVCPVEVESVLRLRPLLNKEREDQVLLKPPKHLGRSKVPFVILDPFHNGGPVGSPRSDTNSSNEYHFNNVLPCETSQDKLYFSLGLPIATSAMDSLKLATSNGEKDTSKSHLLICMGVGNSGKTYTCFGGSSIPKRRSAQDGLVPRLVDSFFSQSKHHGKGSSNQFSVQISIMQVTQAKGKDPHACQIQDLLAPASSKDRGMSPPKRNKSSVISMIKNFERPTLPSPIRSPFASGEFTELDVEDLKPTIKSCKDVTEAREILQAGMSASKKASTGNRTHHLMVTIQPVFNGSFFGDKIAILDMAGLEKGKRSHNRGKDAMPNVNQATNAAVLHCLRTLIHNTNAKSGKRGAFDIMCPDDDASEISCVSQARKPYQNHLKTVPFRQHKLTMLMKPLFTSSLSARVTLLLAAYPGHTDYYEKRTLLQDMELLCGAPLISSSAAVETGFEEEEEEEYESASEVSVDEESLDQDPVRRPPTRKMTSSQWRDPVKPSKPLAPPASMDEEDKDDISMPPPFAPKSRREPPKAYARWLARPSAPATEEILSPPPEKSRSNSYPKKASVASDFPGVRLPTKTVESSPIVERLKTATVLPNPMVGGPEAKAPPSPDEMSWISSQNAGRSVGAQKANAPSEEMSWMSHKAGRSTSAKPNQGVRSAYDDKDQFRQSSRGHHANTPSSPDEMSWTSGGNGRSDPAMTNRCSRPSLEKRPLQPSTSINLESPQTKRATHLKSHTRPKRVTKEINSPIEAERTQVQAAIEGSFAPLSSENFQSANLENEPSSYLSRGMTVSKRVEHKTKFAPPPHELERPTPSSGRDTCGQGHGKRKEIPGANEEEPASRKRRENQKFEDLNRQVKDLEARLKETMQQNKDLETRCHKLEKENGDLKICVREAGRKNLQSKWTQQEEEDWQQSRRLRHEDQKLIKTPILDHLENVNKIYDIKNQWCISHKPHFGLQLPSNFQRASALDVRDKENQNSEVAVKAAVSAAKVANSVSKKRIAVNVGAPPRPNRTPPRAVKLFS